MNHAILNYEELVAKLTFKEDGRTFQENQLSFIVKDMFGSGSNQTWWELVYKHPNVRDFFDQVVDVLRELGYIIELSVAYEPGQLYYRYRSMKSGVVY